MSRQLRPYQRAAIDAIYDYFGRASGHPVIVIPTAGGKSLVMAEFIRKVLEAWPDQRILIITHVRELIGQNHAELLRLWPVAPAGIYSAGLKRREIDAQILFAGIQSIHRRASDVQRADLILVDEAHLIPRRADTMYRRFLGDLATINPYIKVIGLTATPFRLDSGVLHEGPEALFTDLAYEVSVRELIDQGYLCPLVSKQTETQLDVTGVGTRGGEFIASQLEAAVDQDPITCAAVDEIIVYGRERKASLLFCAGIDHARHVSDAVRARGISCATIFGETARQERDEIIGAFRRGEIRALASMGVLTTGFNAPHVDLIAMLRPTRSAGLYVQIAGRGTRLAPGKENCLVLDFAGNVARHGPIDLSRPKSPRGDGEGEAPVKTCPECRSILPAAAAECPDCGYTFPPREIKIERTASTLAILSTGKAQWVDVTEIRYARHDKPGKPSSLRSITAAASSPTASGSASSTPATPGRRRRHGGCGAIRKGSCLGASTTRCLPPTACAARTRSRSARPAASRRWSMRGSHDLPRVPARGAMLGLVRRSLPDRRPATRPQSAAPLLQTLPGHLLSEAWHG
jgi:DNA repair protein RadD